MSTPINDGGPAFPNRGDNTPSNKIYDGMTLRDYFAGQVLAGSMTNKLWDDLLLPEHAEECYRLADAMLAAREGKK